MPYHCLETAAVARQWLGSDDLLLARLSRLSGLQPGVVLKLVTFLACLHDLGKLSDLFQGMAPELMRGLQGRGPGANGPLRHRQLGYLGWEYALKPVVKELGWLGLNASNGQGWLEALETWFMACFWHHGRPEPLDGQNPRTLFRHCFTEQQRQASISIGCLALKICQDGLALPEQNPTDLKPYLAASSWLLAGILVGADWMASNPDYFPYCQQPIDLDQYWQESINKADEALRRSGLLPCRPSIWQGPEELFDYLRQPTPLQAWAAEVELPAKPKLFILEESTGAGKTEAAMILAQRILAQGWAESVFVALPTMATANAMYNRLARYYRRLFPGNANPSLTLAHSMRALHPEFKSTVNLESAANPTASRGEEEDGRAQCTAWLADNNKKALLGSVGIGTVDQAVTALMPVRHQSLRLAGLARSVLILDEVHAYDEYLSKLMRQGLLSHLSALGVNVILLSATLPRYQKERLAQAFCSAYGQECLSLPESSYPLATMVIPQSPPMQTPLATRPERETSFRVDMTESKDEVMERLVTTARMGACACWLRNTVDDAICAYQELAGRLGPGKVHLLHSRFALCDRMRREEELARYFGQASTLKNRKGRVVVGTQVLEMSLDFDFDFMVSDLAPVDLLLQRAGRLHRHMRPDRPISEACLLVHGPLPCDDPPHDWYARFFPSGAHVYKRHALLWRSACLLTRHPVVRLPDHARTLVEEAYDPAAMCPPGLAQWEEKAEGQDQAARSQAWHNALNWQKGYGGGHEFWDEDTPTRLGERMTKLLLARWDGGSLLPWSGQGGWRGWALSQVTVRQNQVVATAPSQDRTQAQALKSLEATLGDRGRGCVLVLLTEADGIWQGRALAPGGEQRRLAYDSDVGLNTQKNN